MMSTQSLASRHCRSSPLRSHHKSHYCTTKRPQTTLIVRAEGKVVREYREGDDDVTIPKNEEEKPSNPQSVYADELPEIKRSEISASMRNKLRDEYYGLGGSPNKPMSGNYFLNIILVISALAILSAALGYI